MTTTTDQNGPATYTVKDATTVTANRRVKILATGLEHAGAADLAVGIAMSTMDAAETTRDRSVAVQPIAGDKRLYFIAAGAITQFAEIEAAADGKVDEFSAGTKLGYIAVNDVAADGDLVLAAPVK